MRSSFPALPQLVRALVDPVSSNLRALTDSAVFLLPYGRIITAIRVLPDVAPWLHSRLIPFLTSPLPAHLKWIKTATGDGWKGVWIAQDAATVNDIDKWTNNMIADFVILDMHGGGFTGGSALMYLRTLIQWLIDLNDRHHLSGRILSVEYSLAPEFKWPQQQNECLAAYEYLQTLVPAEKIILAGDSAGGCLVLNLLSKIHEKGLPRPAGAVTISPWTRLRSDASTIRSLEATDWICENRLKKCEDAYLPKGVDAHQPDISPYYETSFKHYPPLLVTYGTGEIFLDDIKTFIHNVRQDQATVNVLERKNMPHKWSMQPIYCPSLQAWKDDNAALTQWMASRIRATAPVAENNI